MCDAIARWAEIRCESGICRYKYTASDFQSPIREITSSGTPACKANEAPSRLKECVPYWCEGSPNSTRIYFIKDIKALYVKTDKLADVEERKQKACVSRAAPGVKAKA